jgi:hypothetical protein
LFAKSGTALSGMKACKIVMSLDNKKQYGKPSSSNGRDKFPFSISNTVEGNFMFFSKYLRAVDDW